VATTTTVPSGVAVPVVLHREGGDIWTLRLDGELWTSESPSSLQLGTGATTLEATALRRGQRSIEITTASGWSFELTRVRCID
jgi:hypothetical protein